MQILWSVLAVATFGLLVACAAALTYCRRRRKAMKSESRMQQRSQQQQPPIIKQYDVPEAKIDGPLFLLHFPEGPNKAFEAANAALREFLACVKGSVSFGSGSLVYDMSDPDNDEKISEDPEGWVLDALSHPKVQVSLCSLLWRSIITVECRQTR